MTEENFQRIKSSKYEKFVSFAIWNDSDIDDLSVIEKNISDLNQDIVIVGLNISRGVNGFENFHVRHQGGRDSWLKDAFNNGCFRGAYMTDIIKNDLSSRQSKVDLSDNNINSNLISLKEELDFMRSKCSFIIAMGDKVYSVLREGIGGNVYHIPHYAKRGIRKEEFIKAARECEDIFKSIQSSASVL